MPFRIWNTAVPCISVTPKTAIEIGVAQNRHHESFVVGEHRDKVLRRIQLQKFRQKTVPALAISDRLALALVPLSIQGVEGDPLMDQYEVRLRFCVQSLGQPQPTARPMKSNGRGVVGLDRGQSLFVGLPQWSECVNDHAGCSLLIRNSAASQAI